jgi:hypothetical protein
MDLWVQAYEEGRVTDCLIRQALYDIACDRFQHKYSMASVAKQCKVKTQPDKEFDGRQNYGSLDGVPITQWPAEAVHYAKTDAIVTAEIYLAQEQLALIGSPFFPGLDPFCDQFRQAQAALALADISECGVRTNGVDVGRLERLIRTPYARLLPRMIAAGFVTVEYTRNYEAIERLAPALPRTTGGKVSLSRGALLKCGVPAVRALVAWPESQPECAASGVADVHNKRKQKAVRSYFETIHLRKMRRYALGHLAEKPELLRKTPKFGEPPDKVQPIRTDADACEQSGSRLLKAYAEFSAFGKMLTTDLPKAHDAAEMPWNVHYRILQQTGRTSSGADDEDDAEGNGQNKPRKPGIRELYAPRKGNVLFDCDYKALELWTFAQLAKWWVGYSKLGEDLAAGNDPHLRIAAAWLGIPYEEAEKRKKEAELKKRRTGGKGVNFGRKGKMSAKRFVEYCWNSYRVKLGETKEEALATAQLLIDLHDELTPEFPEYSDVVTSLPCRQTYRGDKLVKVYDLVHPYSGRLVAGLYFTDVHNYPFQGLGADVAKRALWLAFKSRWGLSELGKSDPMYKCLLVEFTHDSITGETLRANGRAAAKRLADVMYQASSEICTDYASQTEPALALRMGKGMEPVYGPDGGLLVWDPWEACRNAHAALVAKGLKGRALSRKLESDHSPIIVLDVLAEAASVSQMRRGD